MELTGSQNYRDSYMPTAISEVKTLLDRLPENGYLEDIQYHYVCDGKNPARFATGKRWRRNFSSRGRTTVW